MHFAVLPAYLLFGFSIPFAITSKGLRHSAKVKEHPNNTLYHILWAAHGPQMGNTMLLLLLLLLLPLVDRLVLLPLLWLYLLLLLSNK